MSLTAATSAYPSSASAFGAEALSYAVIAYVAGSTTAYTLGVYVSSNGKASMLQSLRSILRTPSVYALVLAFGLKAAGISELPPALSRTSQLLADASIPLMLILLGLQLGGLGKPSRWRLVVSGTLIRLLLAPLLSLAFASLFGLEGAARLAFILQAGMPTAVMTIVLAYEFDTDRDLALNLIMTHDIDKPVQLVAADLFAAERRNLSRAGARKRSQDITYVTCDVWPYPPL